ncbi:T6SS effector BTH_I2691 family protein [Citrobacter farmeri]|uniref:T6SS effector BTH_I2691 family protein n=1 Tax=Citrobacter farmeri TaxID=67824 RepID=UPI002944B4C0|nr:T6SS effector BTH_I2691 family protein [Citrobacter farmeri]EKU0079036.1 hypothetical protein [Citrobacter farmeri]EKU0082701.1 hypothetical protein [Citrobacter farmeri]HED3137879.1 hypothetical protein [Citrobacter farmeri]HED3140627.1 hypothetical protein [Citrobacter farmeri]
MSTQKGCKFCLRYGLPVLPVRPAVAGLDDNLPALPSSIKTPATAKGETVWTGRLLREGYLYIWSESGNRWISYFATSEGYYYPLPSSGEVPPDIASGKTKPCITHPEELATASLVTLPVKPAGIKNGRFWLSWSEVEWTDAVRKKHENAGYRSKFMQCFDMDAWINSGNAEQVIAISALSNTVAEYSSKAAASKVKEWSPAPWKTVKPMEGQNLIKAADKLYSGKGAMVLLQDPVAVAQDISWLANHRLNTRFYDNPHYARELALTAAVQGLKESVCAQYEREIVFNNEVEELNSEIGYYDHNGMFIPGSPVLGKATHERNVQLLSQRIEAKWMSEYGRYYDKAKEKAFTDTFNVAIRNYDDTVIVPMMKMYTACLDGTILGDYFAHNFDTTDTGSGIFYVQSVTDCIDGFQDKLLVSKQYQEKLAGSCLDKNNILARAAVFNNDLFAEKINSSTHVSMDMIAVPWDRTLDGFKDIFDQKIGAAQLVLEKYQNALNSAVYSLIEKTINSRPVDALVSFAVVANKQVNIITLTADRKHFVTAVVEEMARVFGISGRRGLDQLRHYVDIEVRHLEASRMTMTGQQTTRFAVLADIQAVNEVSNTTGKAGAMAMAKTLRSAEEVKAAIFPNTFRSKLAQLKGSSPATVSASTVKAIPFAGSVLSGAFQIFALVHGGLPKEFNVEATSRFTASVFMAAGSVADSIERLLTNFKRIRWNAQIRVAMSGNFQRWMMRGIRFVKWFGGAVGLVGVIYDGINAYEEFKKGHIDIGIAYIFSAAGGLILTAAVIFSIVLSPFWIVVAVALMLGSAIYLALNIKNDIQLWLMSCLWRKIPVGEKTIPDIWPTSRIEMEQLGNALQSGA